VVWVNPIKGSVEKIGSRVTHKDGKVRVEEIVRISIEPTDEQQKTFKENPIGLIKNLLTQEGHPFRDVKNKKIVSHLRSEWYHIEYDASDPDAVCYWINPDDGW